MRSNIYKNTQIESFFNLKILSFNIHGLENKCLYVDFFTYIKSFDIFALLETHLCHEKSDNFNKYFSGYDLFWKPAVKGSNYGRAIGGCVLGVKKNLINMNFSYSFVTWQQFTVINIKIKSVQFNLVPIYMRDAVWKDEFNNLDSLLNENNIINPIVIGDFNARVGLLQQEIDDIFQPSFISGTKERKSKDVIVNGKGKDVIKLCSDYGLVIMNGRTNGDMEGEFTFASGSGASVIDICAVSQDVLQSIDKFTVGNQIWSDHFPIELSLKIRVDKSSDTTSNLLPKLIWKENYKSNYQIVIKEVLEATKTQQQKAYLEFNDISKVIKDSYDKIYKNGFKYPQKQKWFTAKCYNARNDSFKKLQEYRNLGNNINRAKYIKANKKFKEICNEAKIAYNQKLNEKIEKVKNSKDWWKIAREIRNDDLPQTSTIQAETFMAYFKQLLNPIQNAVNIQYAYLHVDNHQLDKLITTSEIKEVLRKTKSNKAPGEDRVPYEFFKNAPDELLEEVSKTCNVLYDRGCVDDSFILSIIYPIHKKGDASVPSNYRGISFMNCLPKIMMGLLNERLSTWANNNKVLNEYQAGFRKNYSTADNIYSLSSIVHLKYAENKKTYAFFVDFKAAFDKVSRSALIYKLHTLGVSSKAVKFIECIYEKTQTAVWTGNELSRPFPTECGVKQGCLLSPLLFALYLNDLHDYLEGGLHIGDMNIRLLLYADDIVILSDDINILQQMICRLEQYCSIWNVEVNLGKSEIMVFRKGGKLSRKEKWYYKGQEINTVSEYCYLGVVLTPKMSFTKHIERRNQAAKNSINLTWQNFLNKSTISIASKWKLFLAVCRAVQTYGAQVWGYANFQDVDKLQIYFLKKILRLPTFTPTYILLAETDIENGHLYTLDLHIRYVCKTMFQYEEDRLPQKLTKILLQKQLLWVNELNKLGAEFGINWSESNANIQQWNNNRINLINSLKAKYYENVLLKIANTNRIYKKLDLINGSKYLSDERNQYNITWIFKARSDLIKLNGNRFQANASNICTLCNSREIENIQHFLGRCKTLSEFRVMYFKKAFLNEEEILQILNGINVTWHSLANYIKTCVEYRNFLIIEFNN